MESSSPMSGKTVLITGATSGMGHATAMALARLGAAIIVHGRSEAKAKTVVDAIKEETGNPTIYYLLADFSKLEDVRHMAAEVKKNFQHLDVLVNNAGGVFAKHTLSPDGIEMTFQVNYLSHFLLTNLLLDLLRSSAPSRIISISSGLHERGRIDFEDPNMNRKYNGNKSYANSKLAQVMFTYDLAKRLEGTGVTVNAVNPGLVKTHLAYDSGGLMSFSKKFVDLFGKSAEKGADTAVYLATSADVQSLSGKYFEDKKPEQTSEISYDSSTAARLWRISQELTGLVSKGP